MLGRLPKLEHLGYAAQRFGGMGTLDLDGTKGLTPLMRATVMDRRLHADSARTAKQIIAILTAALATRAKVKTFKANCVPWELFSRAPKQWRVLFGAAEHLVSLQLHFLNSARFRRKNGSVVGANLAEFIGSARNLTTLDLDLAGASEEASRSGLKVILEGCLNVAGLKRLVLQSMACREATLKTIISHQAETLRSLELGWIHLLSDSDIDERPGSSWVSIIKFLQSTLKLSHVALEGRLGNGTNKKWGTCSPEQCTNQADPRVCDDEDTLRNRIQRYILHGGDCSIPSEDFWEREGTKGNKGDHSWHIYD